MLINYVQPTEEELFKRYNPELQKRSLEGRDQKLKDANEFIDKIKEYSKSDKPSMFCPLNVPFLQLGASRLIGVCISLDCVEGS